MGEIPNSVSTYTFMSYSATLGKVIPQFWDMTFAILLYATPSVTPSSFKQLKTEN